MNPRLRTWLAGSMAAVVAVWSGFAIAQEDYLLAGVAAVVCGWGLLAWIGGPRIEASILAFLLLGYVVGNRGFAQLTPIGGLPLFFGELGLGAALALTVLHHTFEHNVPVRRDGMNSLLALLILLGVGRMLFDVRVHGFAAIRDFATIYYALFFFVAQSLATHEASSRLIARTMTVTFSLLPLTILIFTLNPDFFFRYASIRGVPLIHYKGDLITIFLFAGFVWLLPTEGFAWRLHWWRTVLAVLSLGLGLHEVSRAGIVGLVVALLWLTLARCRRPLAFTVVVCVTGLVGASVNTVMSGKDFSQSRAYAVYEHIESIADWSGTKTYRNPETADSGENNQFRLVWWRAIARETLADAPLLGLGFGHDLARNFTLNYYPTLDGDFTVRSPHSILFTLFGRMGTIGLFVWLGLMAALAAETLRAVRANQREASADTRSIVVLLAICWIVLTGACFGVVLEGPMGAIPFWILLGFAHAQIGNLRASPGAARTEEAGALALAER